MSPDKPTPERLYPGHPQPPGRGRVDVNPSDEPGIDELPDNEGELPRDREEWENLEDMPDTDPDQGERDGVINPR
ncbi:MAG TPA: hypothetical protein VL129_12065 [Pseudomonas sp.]|jgi:hypothetical protein|uniref:hypothetical protein n=1 Tax=Pseudomonas sp. TaxID=306 RepID=UPI002D1E3287|nr:hypothetical protein [Pseudomonas sp.]HTO19868.1 hypothetical protein [Pseudomonas sp.]